MLDTKGYKHTIRICNTAFPLQQWLSESAWALGYTHFSCLVFQIHYSHWSTQRYVPRLWKWAASWNKLKQNPLLWRRNRPGDWKRWGIPNATVKWKYSEHSYHVSNPDPQCGRADAVRHCTVCFVTSYNCIALPINAAVVVLSQKAGYAFASLASLPSLPPHRQVAIKNRRQLISCLKIPCSYGTRRL
jgi:hypothetical protein